MHETSVKPVLKTERLLIRTPQLGDEIPINQAVNRSLKELQRWMPWASDPSLKTTTAFVKSSMRQWNSKQPTLFPMVVIHKQDKLIIGASGYNEKSDPQVPFYEIGYWLDTQYTGFGLGTELTVALTRYAFEVLSAIRVQICVQADNFKSIRVAEKCGFALEARLHHHRLDCKTGKPADDLIYACFDTSKLPLTQVTW
ncbi:Putative ribosomal N-acetyltransferase YdaF [Legionella lansingensis]|uniref:Putative ribosomal N-acetyltransferase YdaF n=1 Tax=Legionella lansingensis TaxID=45067 RepID=A0A0W0VKF2_9GAMM|nr:GNAT family protein [Legionella lansingensis]KTD20594.1 putative ribosomal N-acetyltransferase YdaF [Legionella lansingensis]SNV46282.1 Putative ribosomal N-acetyltransferase YdaF [Legionella lansingensis]